MSAEAYDSLIGSDAKTDRPLAAARASNEMESSAPMPLGHPQAQPSRAMAVASYPPLETIAVPRFEFSSNICECCFGPVGCQTCLMAFFLPCIAHGIIADAASGGRGQEAPCLLYVSPVCAIATAYITHLHLFAPCVQSYVLGTLARAKLRSKYGLKGSNTMDFCLHFFCHPCSMAQELRELQALRARAGVSSDTLPPPVGMALAGVSIALQPPEDSGSRGSHKLCSRDWAKDLTAAYL